jgi:hypothetical protein
MDDFPAIGFPGDVPGIFRNGEQVRILVLIAEQNELVLKEYRRRPHSMQVGERTERHAPALVSVFPVGDQAEIGEESIDILAVGNWSGRGRAVEFVQLFRAGR